MNIIKEIVPNRQNFRHKLLFVIDLLQTQYQDLPLNTPRHLLIYD
ncbi:MAG: hypothetical protein AAGF83_26885 [Cyanobacteria bacterium P01_G01_bin.67]